MRVLIVAPHPDDETLGCGGTAARHADAGDDVYPVIVSRGAPDMYSDDEIDRTRDELRAAHEILGLQNATFLDFPAPRLDAVPSHEIADALRLVVRDLAPDVVYGPHWGDLHVDHRVTCEAVLVATRPIEHTPIHRVLCYETLSESEWGGPSPDRGFLPNVFVNIEDTVKRKLEAMATYRSQLREFPHPRSLKAVEMLAGIRGTTIGTTAAEAFVLVREIV